MIPLLSLLLVLPIAAQGRVVKLDGSSVTGNITAATIEKIEVQSGSDAVAVAPGDVLRLSFVADSTLIRQATGYLKKLEFQNAINLLTEAEGQADPAWMPPYAKLLKAEALLSWSGFDKNRAGEASAAFTEWIATYPDHYWQTRARLGQATAMGRAGKVQDAGKALQDLAGFAFDKNLGKHVEFLARLTRCEVFLEGNEAALAKQRLEGSNGLVATLKTAANSPESPTALRTVLHGYWVRSQILLGDSLEQASGLDDAKRYWENVLRSEKKLSDDARANGKIVIARASREAGKLREAQFALAEIAATLNCGPDTMARALFTLGEVCQELGDKPTPGTTYFRRVVERYPASPWAAKARKKLGN
ncbi:MAG: hypothetical protein HQ519_14195 [Planctomycetes bacterium]|nr:hypothetical protein [Planctomycetota bacterium]